MSTLEQQARKIAAKSRKAEAPTPYTYATRKYVAFAKLYAELTPNVASYVTALSNADDLNELRAEIALMSNDERARTAKFYYFFMQELEGDAEHNPDLQNVTQIYKELVS